VTPAGIEPATLRFVAQHLNPKLTGRRKRRRKQLLGDRKEKRILEILKKHQIALGGEGAL